MQQFNIDIQSPHGPLVLYVAQGDAQSRIFQITVTDGGASYTFPEGAAFSVRYGAQGMPSGWYDQITEADGSTRPAVSAAANVLTVEVASQATGKAGANALNVVVNTAEGYQLASWPFLLIVTPVPGSSDADASVYYDLLSQQVAQVLANAQAAAASATLAESWAVGGTGTREGEDTNNAQYWAEQAQQVSQGALGWYETEQALQAAHPTGQNGQWAIVGSTDTIWTWDSDTSAWVDSGSTADLSNYYTKTQADAAFATAAQGALAASAVQSVNGKSGTAVTLGPQDVGGLSTYTCATTGSTHALTGTGNNIKFVADAAFAAGDTITVNGTTVTAQTQDGAALDAGAWAEGAVVVCYLNGTTLNFKGGGGLSPADMAKLIPENIRAGVTIAKVTGTLTWQDLLPETMIVQAGYTIDDFVGGGIVKYGDVNFLNVRSTGIVWTCQQNNATAIFSKEINTEDWQAVEFDISLTRYNSSTRCKFGVGSNANGDTGWVAYKQFNDTTFSRTTIRVDIPMEGTTFVKGWCNWVSNVTLYKTTLIKRQ